VIASRLKRRFGSGRPFRGPRTIEAEDVPKWETRGGDDAARKGAAGGGHVINVGSGGMAASPQRRARDPSRSAQDSTGDPSCAGPGRTSSTGVRRKMRSAAGVAQFQATRCPHSGLATAIQAFNEVEYGELPAWRRVIPER